jgi:hypothetical protein
MGCFVNAVSHHINDMAVADFCRGVVLTAFLHQYRFRDYGLVAARSLFGTESHDTFSMWDKNCVQNANHIS